MTAQGDLLILAMATIGYLLVVRAHFAVFIAKGESMLPAWAHPVIANGQLYVRDQDVLFCYDLKAR